MKIKNRKTRKIKKFTNKMQANLLLVFCIIIIGLIVIIGKMTFLTQKDGEQYAKKVLAQQTYTSNSISYKRGSIIDRNGTILAFSDKAYNLILDVKLMRSGENEKYVEPTITALTSSFDSLSKEELMQLTSERPDSQYVILEKELSYDEMMVFEEYREKEIKKNKKEKKENMIQGVWFEEVYVRKYPHNTLASDIVGFTTDGNVGNWGIEQYYNNELNGTQGISFGYMNNELNLETKVYPATHGHTVVSTIDGNAQSIVQKHIKEFNEEFGSENIGVLIMNPNNGEILSMASNHEYDLNNPTDLKPFLEQEDIDKMSEEEKMEFLNGIWRNYIISDSYEPGSTFKPFTVAAGLEEAIIKENDTFECDGHEVVGGWTISCSNRTGHGVITLTESLMLSCNDALMQIAEKEGENLFYDYHTFFGFGDKTGIDLPGEAEGLIVSKDTMDSADLATSSFGQTFTTTMIQLASGYSSLINGGDYYTPHIVKQILNDDGAVVREIGKEVVKKSVSSKTSDFIKNAMYLTVEEGTANPAAVEGYTVGGKTGTAQKQPRADKTYVVSFIGNVPADDPEIVIYVVIDEPQNVEKQADSSIATNLASKILKEVLPFLEIYPSTEIADTQSENETVETDADTNTETDAEADTDGDADTNTDAEADTETESDEEIDDEFFPDAIPGSDE